MRFEGLFVVLLLIGMFLPVYGHPVAINMTVQSQDGIILFQQGLLSSKLYDEESLEWFSEKWVRHNFIWILMSFIAATISVVGIMVHSEEIKPKFSNIIKHSSNFTFLLHVSKFKST